jgi:hypothetical protein
METIMKEGSDILQQKRECQMSEHTHTHISKRQQNRKSVILLTANSKMEKCNPTLKEVKKSKDTVNKRIRNNLKIKTIAT